MKFELIVAIFCYLKSKILSLLPLSSSDMYLGIKFFVDFSNLTASPLDANSIMKNNQTGTKIVQHAGRVTNEIYLLLTRRTIMPYQP